LQPIVENAVKHGVAPFPRPGFVSVRACVVNGRLHLDVADSGGVPAAPGALSSSSGRGLHITRRRLETCYGNRFTLTLDRGAGLPTAHADVPLDLSDVA